MLRLCYITGCPPGLLTWNVPLIPYSRGVQDMAPFYLRIKDEHHTVKGTTMPKGYPCNNPDHAGDRTKDNRCRLCGLASSKRYYAAMRLAYREKQAKERSIETTNKE